MRGLFITIEGIDGCGKSVQSARLAHWLEGAKNRVAVRTFEPGGWDGGEQLRSFILHGNVPYAETELLLFLADRSGHVNSVILPALNAGKTVVCERYEDSTWAYQAGGGGLPPERIAAFMELCAFPKPDITLFLDIAPDEAAARLASRGRPDRIEGSGRDFMVRVASVYRERAAVCPERIVTVDASGTEDEVAGRIENVMSAFLRRFAGKGSGI